jgi:hypothetical protein
MKFNRTPRMLVFVLLLASISLSAVVPVHPAMAAPAQAEDLVRLTIENRSNDYVTLRLTGPRFYYFSVKPGETRIFTPVRDVYDSTLYSCGVFTSDSMDLTKIQYIVVPACGTKGTKAEGATATDASAIIKLVKVTIENKAESSMVLILEGPGTYVFFLRAGEEKSYTIPKGEYDLTMYACWKIKKSKFYAYANKVQEYTCP